MLPVQRTSTAWQLRIVLTALLASVMGHGGEEHGWVAPVASHNGPEVLPTTGAADIKTPQQHGLLHRHSSHLRPLEEFNESVVLLTHDPPKLAFYQFDADPSLAKSETLGSTLHPDWLAYADQRPYEHSKWLVTHVILSSFAFFGALPFYAVTRITGHQSRHLGLLVFLSSALGGHVAGLCYSAKTPDLYPGTAHRPLGLWALVLGSAVACHEWSQSLLAGLRWLRAHEGDDVRRQSLLATMLSPSRIQGAFHQVLYQKLENSGQQRTGRFFGFTGEPTSMQEDELERTFKLEHDDERGRQSSPGSDGSVSTLHDHDDWVVCNQGRLARMLDLVHTFVSRALVLVGFASFLTGIVTYSGSCQGLYDNGCLAHLIKGGIFFWYGLLTFGRYAGCWREYGWAWNLAPQGARSAPTAEFTESAVICFYGATAMFMERFGSQGEWTAKDIQHESIAVMFFFAGAMGMALEARAVRNLMRRSGKYYIGNPFPALVIAVTGYSMAMHHQTFAFSVSIHMLWGSLLAAFGAFRLFTCIILTLSPPKSTEPGQPVTEILASFCLTAGGVAFMLSSEQVVNQAMRTGYDDVMAFMCFTVSIVLGCMLWTYLLMTLKEYTRRR